MEEDGTCGRCPEYCAGCGGILDDKRDRKADVDPDAVFCTNCQKRLRNEQRVQEHAIKAEQPKPKRKRKPKPKQSVEVKREEPEPATPEPETVTPEPPEPPEPEQTLIPVVLEPPLIPESQRVRLRFRNLPPEPEPEPVPVTPIDTTPEPLDNSPTIIYHSSLRPKKKRKPKPLKPKELEPEPSAAQLEPEPLTVQPEASAELEPVPDMAIVEQPAEPQEEIVVDLGSVTQLFGIDIVRKR
jgi:hypothetical protein